MTFQELRKKIAGYPIFTFNDVLKWFPRTNPKTLEVEISHWIKSGHLKRAKRGIYVFSDFEIEDPFILANFIYSPSYISLESALNCYSIIPDIPFSITSVTLKKTVQFSTKEFGDFYYRCIKPGLFFGFENVQRDKYGYNIAFPEKAIFDFLYLNYKRLNLKTFPQEERFYFGKDFDWNRLEEYSSLVPSKNKKFHALKELLFNYVK